MAQKRMFDKAIIDTDKFLNISLTAKALYFLMGMEADDEGFVSPNKVLRLYGGEYGDIKNLIDGGFLIPFQSGVVVITHWNENNYLDKNRIKPTQYQDEKKMLALTEHKKYELNKCLTRGEESSIEESRIEYINEDKSSGNEVNQFIELFKPINPTYSKLFKMKNQRKSCENLLKIRPLKEWVGVVAFIGKQIGDKYCPRIATPSQLEDKYANLVSYGAGLKTSSNKNQIYGL